MAVSTPPRQVDAPDAQQAVGDERRLEAVRRTGLLDSPPEEAFDRLTRLAAELVGVPVAFISIVDAQRDFYKSCYGFGQELSETREMRGTTFCHYAIASDTPLVINDTRADPVFAQVPTVTTLGVAAYLGFPLRLSSGEALGSFCVIDVVPRVWQEREIRVLSELARSALREIELRLAIGAVQERVSDAERARQLAAQNEAGIRGRHELILSATADGIFGLDASGRVTFMNPAAAKLLGWTPEEVLGRDQHQYIHSRRADGSPYPAEECPIYRVLRDGITRRGDDEIFIRTDGTAMPVEFTSQAILEDGSITGAVVTFRDMTQRLEAEARARSLESERTARVAAEASAKAREEFFAMISHELRTPMTSIRGWVGIVRDGSDEETLRIALDAIDTSSRMQAQLIDDLLDVTRMSRGKLRVDPSVIDLQKVLRETISQLQPSADGRGISIRSTLLPEEVLIYADERRIEQVFNNLLGNALKFTQRGGLVSVNVACKGEEAVVRVSDTGRGIEAELLSSIFLPYRQAESGALGGLGLGLAIVKHLVEVASGSVHVESEGKGKGATFTVRLPRFRDR